MPSSLPPHPHAMHLSLSQAAAQILAGHIVAFPTETVYGIGANAFDAEAVRKIYTLKGRPSSNPLIIHIRNKNDLGKVVSTVDPISQKLIDAFWPGPLTLILPKHPNVPEITTAGLSTVAVRMPAHPLAQALLNETDVPIAAPSANPSGKPSATHHKHVEAYFGNELPVIAGGETNVGIESTVVMVRDNVPHVLRLGSISEQNIKNATGITPVLETSSKHSPGTTLRHYAPHTPLILVAPEKLTDALAEHTGKRIGFLALDAHTPPSTPNTYIFSLGPSETTAAQRLYAGLFALDHQNLDLIIGVTFPHDGLGKALNDRLTRAATQH